ncbi:protein kinase domain-containing protein [Desulfosporosinus sp. SB140]|uniref:protein kinase domain-containing protein n=1 Tax=Desulfosporosinus paludis TaxID=3115649 RepID=UPI003890E259
MKKLNSWHNDFDIIEELGEGGNAKVYHVKEKSSVKEFALKELYNKSTEKKARFIDELNIAKENSSIISGIIPIIISNEEEYWYTMPIAVKIQGYLKDKSIKEIVSGVVQLSETLVRLHEKGISHRDIKPSNIYLYDDKFSLGDFGLVDFPDNPNDFTRSDKGLGAIFTIAPEMKRDPKHANGKKADVFSLAKTLWMFFSGDERGFDGVYNYLDPSHSLRYIEKYKSTHLVELDELLKDATDNNPNLRPTIKEFKERLNVWIEIYCDEDKAQASDWNFLNKQLFGSNSPESSAWRNSNNIVEVLNIVGMTPAYNHMLFSDRGGLDFCYAELASEVGCINLYDGHGSCFIVKPKCLCYEGFNENYKWNYFLLELDKLNPIFEENDVVSYEYLVEDMPAHYVSASCAQYGVYDYDKGEPLPEGYKTVCRYIRGKFLIVMKSGPYNGINGTYDGRHGLCSNSDFRNYIDKLITLYSDIYTKVKQDGQLRNASDDEIERRILGLRVFNKNPFSSDKDNLVDAAEIKLKIAEEQKSKKYIKDNYSKWCFSAVLESEKTLSPKVKFCFEFSGPDNGDLFDFLGKPLMYICKDGYIKELKSPLDDECYYMCDRIKAISLKDKFQQVINNFLHQSGQLPLEEYENCISIKLIKCGKPTHLFTKHEIEEEMQKADDRVHNQLVIDEDGYAKVIKDEGYGYLFPVRHESWDAGNIYVGKYSKLLSLDDDYISSLQGWLSYLKTGRKKYMDYVHDNRNEEELLDEIKQYY